MSSEDHWDKVAPVERGNGGRCGEEPANGDEPQQAAVSEREDSSRASLGITPSMSSLEGTDPSTPDKASSTSHPSTSSPSAPSPSELWTGAIDWIEVRGRVDWSQKREAVFKKLHDVFERARETKEDQEHTVGEFEVFVCPDGMGRGRQSRMTYRLRRGDVTIAFADRNADSRRHSNFYCNIPGRACLISGAINSLQDARKLIQVLGGRLDDEWFQRLDLCVDLPRVDFERDFYPALESRHFITTSKKWNPYHGPDGTTGFSVCSGNLHLRFYDKRKLVFQKPDEVVQEFMRIKRWHGEIPPCATRVEIELRREAMHRYGLNTTDEALRRVPDLVDKLLGTQPYVFFRLLDGEFDRANKHQSRAGTHPLWTCLVDTMSKISGEAEKPLKTNPRASLSGKNEAPRVVNGLIRDAAARGQILRTRAELIEQLESLFQRNLIEDEDIERKSILEARRRGTLEEASSFNPSIL